MIYSVRYADKCFFLKNRSEGMSASGTAESLFFAERKKPPE